MKFIYFLMLTTLSSALLAQNNYLWTSFHQGGANNRGTIVSVDTDGTFHLVHSFAGLEGSAPIGDLVISDNGYIFGTAEFGGQTGSCTLFRVDTSTMDVTVAHDFGLSRELGELPSPSLIKHSDGKLYGMTFSGGAYNLGSIYSFDPLTNSYLDVYDFDSTTGGSAGNLLSYNGILYGATDGQDTPTDGVIFSFTTSSNNFSVLYNITDTTGYIQKMIHADDGNLYGIAHDGGLNHQRPFKFNLISHQITFLYDFSHFLYNGEFDAGFYEHTDGTLYLISGTGNIPNPFQTFYGSILAYNPTLDSFIVKASFNQNTGYSPSSAFTRLSNGTLVGCTRYGGTHNNGTFFTFDPLTNIITPIYNIDSSMGISPNGGFLEANPKLVTTYIKALEKYNILQIFPNPANSYINISGAKEGELLVVTNQLGEVLSTTISKKGKTKLDISQFPNGVYYLNKHPFIKKQQ